MLGEGSYQHATNPVVAKEFPGQPDWSILMASPLGAIGRHIRSVTALPQLPATRSGFVIVEAPSRRCG